MILENQDLLNEFFEKNKDKYPDISYEQFKDIVFGPWRFLKQEMENGNLETVRLKYFGTFVVYPRKASSELEKLKKRFEEGTIVHKEYFRLKAMIEKFLENESKD